MNVNSLAGIGLLISMALLFFSAINYYESREIRKHLEEKASKPCSCQSGTITNAPIGGGYQSA